MDTTLDDIRLNDLCIHARRVSEGHVWLRLEPDGRLSLPLRDDDTTVATYPRDRPDLDRLVRAYCSAVTDG